MTIPSRAEALGMLRELDPPAWLLRHSAAVGEVAAFLADRIKATGTAIDVELVEAAALLHDVDKALSRDDPHQALGHGAAGAAWLTERGHAELGAAVAAHPARRLTDPDYERWQASASLEERVVAYADKRAEEDIVSLDDRFAGWRDRHPERAASLELGRGRARDLEAQVCAVAGIGPDEIDAIATDEIARSARDQE
jgi:putative nucleotidyltransferase with HDIG domain